MNHPKNVFAGMAAVAAIAAVLFAGQPALAQANQHEERTEARIADLHAKLGIMPDQEMQWQKVAGIMRDNAKEMDALTDERMTRQPEMDAVDDMESYGEIAEAHADGMRKLTPAFAALYETMNEEQKEEADELFRHGPGSEHHHHHQD